MTLGAVLLKDGTRFAVHSADAEAVELCLFDPERRIPMLREGDVWTVTVEGVGEGAQYGFRAHGPFDPAQGLWFDGAKLLLDPYARQLTAPVRWSPALQPGTAEDSARALPRCIVTKVEPVPVKRPRTPWPETVIYEAHVRGLTMQHPKIPEGQRGTFRGLASRQVLRHLSRLGVTAIELLPVQAFIDDRFAAERGLTNYWGYQPVALCAPHPAYGTPDDFRAMVRKFHKAGIEVILDIVLNHTGEGDAHGPSVSLRGLDNRGYYRLRDGHYLDDAGTGNTLDATRPAVQRLFMDTLRHWAAQGVDGFRFDLATTLGRGAEGFSPRAAIFDMIRQDPQLRDLKLIAEPWDIGPGGYQLGQFPAPFAEWNDRFRDDLRRFWRGEAVAGAVAARMAGSAEMFDHDRRPAWTSVNFLTAHDGFTLMDVVQYAHRHNEANGEDGRDGHGENHSDNMGHEGPHPDLEATRALRRRGLMASLLLAQGTPMLLAGDEMGNSQGGNNNTYAQDNEVGWVAWRDDDLAPFVARLIALRRSLPPLRQRAFWGDKDVVWYLPDGRIPAPEDWAGMTALCMELRFEGGAAFVVLNPGHAVPLNLPAGRNWHCVLDSTQPAADPPIWGLEAPAHSVLVFRHTD
ncbi:glycogen debranching protein GlgX [Falsirhodobacter algicola]|uniref:Glycogen debranching protein GlgX n=1 Tax=Falsirhodobacter algicola TaxID=2692330 RepID=A0A8J8MRS7_9RHOB|nr:glycogen debranching protein GlgX [Falsirhodobacter algicola]QUS35239.1 glycogen debranching protein GlgX [Falsirhodobacter algicola]